MCSLMNQIGQEGVPFEVKGNSVAIKLNGSGYVVEALKDPKEKIHLPYLPNSQPELDLAAIVFALDAVAQEAYERGVKAGVEIWAERDKQRGLMSRCCEKELLEKYGIVKSAYDK